MHCLTPAVDTIILCTFILYGSKIVVKVNIFTCTFIPYGSKIVVKVNIFTYLFLNYFAVSKKETKHTGTLRKQGFFIFEGKKCLENQKYKN